MAEQDDAIRYLPPDQIDPAHIQLVFRQLVLFDDVYLNMQAININIIDNVITDQEYQLLSEWIETERTPTQQAMFVSALSQMWIFALYELLRTWRQRIRSLVAWQESGGLDEALRKVKSDKHNFAALIRTRHIERIRDEPQFVLKLRAHLGEMEGVFRMTEAIRINLAKHEVRGKKGSVVRAPGYGRINFWCGALDFELDRGDNSYEIFNRRDIADALRQVTVSNPD